MKLLFCTPFHGAANRAPLDKVEPNLKKIPHRNGIWGLEANSM